MYNQLAAHFTHLIHDSLKCDPAQPGVGCFKGLNTGLEVTQGRQLKDQSERPKGESDQPQHMGVLQLVHHPPLPTPVEEYVPRGELLLEILIFLHLARCGQELLNSYMYLHHCALD